MNQLLNGKKNSIFPTVGRSVSGMFLLRILSQCVTFVTIAIITRLLGPEEFGRYAFLFAFITMFTLFNVNGLNDILVREMAARRDRRDLVYRNGLALKLIAGGFALILVCSILLVFDITDLPFWVCCVAALTLLFSFSLGSVRQVWDVNYQVDFRMASASAINLSGRILFLALLIFWGIKSSVSGGGSIAGLPINAIAGGVITVIALQMFSEGSATLAQSGLNLRNGYRMLPGWDLRVVRYLIKEVWPLAVSGALGMFYTKVNLLLLQYFLTERDVGLFALPMRLVDALGLLPVVFIWAVMPILSRLYKTSRDEFLNLVKLSYRLMMLVSLPISVVVALHSKTIITFFSGESFIESAPVLSLLIWSSTLWFTSLIFSYVLVASGRQKRLMVIYAVQAVLSICLNIIFIPRFGIQGAAWVTLIVYFIQFPAAILFSDIRYTGTIWFKALAISLPSTAVAYFIVKLSGFGIILSILLVLIIIPGLALLTGYISRRDITTIRDIVRSRAQHT